MIRYTLPVTLVTSVITAKGEDSIADYAEKITRDYATNDSGEGLFVWADGCWKQMLGNSQFFAKDRMTMLRKTREYRTKVSVLWSAKALAERDAEERSKREFDLERDTAFLREAFTNGRATVRPCGTFYDSGIVGCYQNTPEQIESWMKNAWNY